VFYSVWPYDLENMFYVLRLALGWFLPSMTFDTLSVPGLCYAVTFTFDPLIFKVRGTLRVTWSKSSQNLTEIEQSPAELLIIFASFAHVMLRCDLDLWPLDL